MATPGQATARVHPIGRFGALGGLGAIFTVDRIARKLCRIILLRFGLVIFKFHYWRTRKSFFMVLGPSRRDHDSQNQLFFVLEILGYLKIRETPNRFLKSTSLGNLYIS